MQTSFQVSLCPFQTQNATNCQLIPRISTFPYHFDFHKTFVAKAHTGWVGNNNLIQLNHGKTKQKSVADRRCVPVGIRCVRTGQRLGRHPRSHADGNELLRPCNPINLCDWCGGRANRRR